MEAEIHHLQMCGYIIVSIGNTDGVYLSFKLQHFCIAIFSSVYIKKR